MPLVLIAGLLPYLLASFFTFIPVAAARCFQGQILNSVLLYVIYAVAVIDVVVNYCV